MTWTPQDHASNYVVRYGKAGDCSSKSISIFGQSRCKLTRQEHSIEPLNTYEITVQATDTGNCVSLSVFVGKYTHAMHWQRTKFDFPQIGSADFLTVNVTDIKGADLTLHSVVLNMQYYSVSTFLHLYIYIIRYYTGSSYCLYPECTMKASNNHFCSAEHFELAKRKGELQIHCMKILLNILWIIIGVCGLVNLNRASSEYNELASTFSKTWCSEKGRLPVIHHILKIVNPKLKQRFESYLATMPWPYDGVEKYYHGTQVKCNMLQYYEPCSNNSCGVCGISKEGFDPERISNRSWQRFGKGFYFAPNSSKSYDYPRATHSPANLGTNYRCMLVCDIAPGRKYTVYKNDPLITGPPEGYHSIYGKSRWMWFWKSPDLNYDELVVFNTAAIRPHYILFLEDTS